MRASTHGRTRSIPTSSPVNLTDPSGHCYPPLGFLRRLEGSYCTNLDKAIWLVRNPQVPLRERGYAGVYIAAWILPHAALLAGAGILGGHVVAGGASAIGSGVISVSHWAAPYVVSASVGGAGVATLPGRVPSLPTIPPELMNGIRNVCINAIGAILSSARARPSRTTRNSTTTKAEGDFISG